METMPLQNFQMLRTIWGLPQYQSNAPLHSPIMEPHLLKSDRRQMLMQLPDRTIAVDPSIKLEWLKEHWEAADVDNTREWMLQAVRRFFLRVVDDVIFGCR